jgi:hypothetical protein
MIALEDNTSYPDIATDTDLRLDTPRQQGSICLLEYQNLLLLVHLQQLEYHGHFPPILDRQMRIIYQRYRLLAHFERGCLCGCGMLARL